MEKYSLQAKDYKELYQRCRRNRDFSELLGLIKKIFSKPDQLNQSFKANLYRYGDQTAHNVEFDFLYRFYYDVAVGYNNESVILFSSLDQLLTLLDQQPEKKPLYLRSYFMLLLNAQLYENATLFPRLLILISSIPDRLKLSNWLLDIDSQRIARLVTGIQKVLSHNIGLLLPGPEFDKVDHKFVTAVIGAACKVLEVVYKRYFKGQGSNNMKERIQPEMFENRHVNTHFNPKQQFLFMFKGEKTLNFTEYPFLLNLDYKNKLLKVETFVQQQLSQQKGMINAMGGAIPPEVLQQAGLTNVMYMQLQLHRNNLLDESLDRLSGFKSLKNPLKIKFVGEPGDDGGGIKKQYFQLIMKEIFNPCRDMFIPKNNERYYWLNGDSFEAPIMFEFVGKILGLAIYNNTLLDLKFPKVLYKKLLAPQNQQFLQLSDLSQLYPDFQKSFRHILQTNQPLQSMQMTFQAETEVFGEKVYHDLKQHGKHYRLSQNNKQQYVKLYTNWLLNVGIQRQFKAFRRGFYTVVTGSVIKLFSPEQLQRVICGQENLDFKDLQKTTKYQSGYTSQTPIIRALWQILHNYDLATKKSFLFFTTGSDRSPIGGLSNLRFTIQRHGPDSNNLPTAHTCSNVFLLPEYNSKQKLQSKLQLSLRHKEGFGLI